MTTKEIRLPPIRVDRRAVDALRGAIQTAIDNAVSEEPEQQELFDKPQVRFSATFWRGGWRHGETVDIDDTDIDRLNEPVRTTTWSMNATRRVATAAEHSVRIHARHGRARLSVTSGDAAWRRAAISSVLDVAEAHAPRCRWCHHWSARAATGVAVALGSATGMLLAPSEPTTAFDAGIAAFTAMVLGGWAAEIHAIASRRHSHLLMLEPNEEGKYDA